MSKRTEDKLERMDEQLIVLEDIGGRLEQAKHRFLKQHGIAHTCSTPGSLWMYEVCLPDGRVALLSNADVAIRVVTEVLYAEQDEYKYRRWRCKQHEEAFKRHRDELLKGQGWEYDEHSCRWGKGELICDSPTDALNYEDIEQDYSDAEFQEN